MYTKKDLKPRLLASSLFISVIRTFIFCSLLKMSASLPICSTTALPASGTKATDQSVHIRSTHLPSDGISISSADILTYRISLRRSCASVHCVFHAPRSTRCMPSLLLIFESPTVARNLSPFRFFCWCHDRNIRWNPRNRLYNEGWEIYNLRPVFCKHVP